MGVLCCCAPPQDRVGSVPTVQVVRPNHEAFHGVTKRRSFTDVGFLAFFLVFVFFLGLALYYAGMNGDVSRLIYGHDGDGDVCGKVNQAQFNVTGSGKDIRMKPFLVASLQTCVASCPANSTSFLRRCLSGDFTLKGIAWFINTVSGSFIKQVAIDFELCWKEVVYLCLLACGLSFIMTFLFRYCAGVLIWVLLATLVIGSLSGAAYLWWVWSSLHMTKDAGATPAMIIAIVASVIAVVICLVVFVMRKRVELVVTLFYEAGKALHSMPQLMFQPLWTLLVLVLVCSLWIYAAVLIESAGLPSREIDRTSDVHPGDLQKLNITMVIENLIKTNRSRRSADDTWTLTNYVETDPALTLNEKQSIANLLYGVKPWDEVLLIKALGELKQEQSAQRFMAQFGEPLRRIMLWRTLYGRNPPNDGHLNRRLKERSVRDSNSALSSITSLADLQRLNKTLFNNTTSEETKEMIQDFLGTVQQINRTITAGPVSFRKDPLLLVIRWYNLFAAIWFSYICFALQHLVVAGAVAHWFFTRDKTNLGHPVVVSMNNAFYHVGSAALGSFLLALFTFLIYVLKFVERKIRSKANCCGVTRCLKCCCKSCVYFFKKFLQVISTNAYIEIALYGDDFCESAGRALKIIFNNALRVSAINSVGDFVLFLGKVGIVACTVIIGVEILKDKQGVVYFWAPLSIAAVFAFLIAHCFISVYEMCIDTVFICFCEDCEMNDGLQRPYFMSRGLMEFVEKSRRLLVPHQSALVTVQPAVSSVQQQPMRGYDNSGMIVNDGGRIWTTRVPPPNYTRQFQPSAPPSSLR